MLDGRPRRVLLLCYATGWQVWDLESSGGSREPHELVSLRDGPVTAALVLSPPDGPTTHTAATATATGQYPMFAVCGPETDAKSPESAGDDGEEGVRVTFLVRIYSMPLGRYIRTIPFQTPVLALRASRSGVLAVLASQQVTCMQVDSADVLFSSRTLPCDSPPARPHEPHIQPFGALALTSRWVAFASAEPAPPSMQQRLASVPSTGSAVAAAAHFAKLGGSALLKMGDAGIRAVHGFISPQQSPREGGSDPAPAPPDAGHAAATGTVLVRDMVARTTVAHFRAHGSPLCGLAFSALTPSGCHNLVTASVHGTCVHVYAVGGGSVHQLYRLQRGWSPAIVQHLAFSRDANWLAVSTAKGTTHLFAINHGGGPVSADTHARCPAAPCDATLVAGSPPAAGLPWTATGSPSELPALPATETLHAVARVRATGDGWLGAVAHRVSQAGALVGMPFEAGAMACALRTLADADTGGEAQRELLVVTPTGALTRYLLRARAADDPGAPLSTDPALARSGPRPLGVTLVPLERWDVRRCPSWPERHGATSGAGLGSSSGGIAALPPPPSYEEAVRPVQVPGSDVSGQGRSAASLPAVDDSTQVLIGSPSPASLAASPTTPASDAWPRPVAASTSVVAASVYGTDSLAMAAGPGTSADMHESWGSDADADEDHNDT